MDISTSLFYGKRYKHLSQALAEVVDDNEADEVDIVIIPPDVDMNTDEEDGDADIINEINLPGDVPGCVEVFNKSVSFDSDDEIPLAQLQSVSTRKHCVNPIWKDEACDLTMSSSTTYIENKMNMKMDLDFKSPVDVFETLFDNDVVQLIIEQSTLYALQNNAHKFTLDEDDLKVFLAILFYSGYHSMPRESMYWQLDEDTLTPLVSNNMTKNRFFEIKRYIHFANNSGIDKSDKMAKLRPLSNLLCEKFQKWGFMHEKLSIDEAMPKYFGHHSAKQFIRGKPVRFGFKNWMLTSSCGYLYQFDTYCGAKNVEIDQKHLPLGSRVVLDLIKTINTPSDHIIYFDNFFTSHDLLRILRESNFKAVGTTRENRTKNCPLNPKKKFQKQTRGYFEKKYDHNNKILFVKWNDNNVVTMGTNFVTVEPMKYVKRWSKQEQKKINIPQPNLLSNYNNGMGGVDLHDQAVNVYKIGIRGKKWWWPLFISMMSSTLVNAWKLYKEVNNSTKDLLEFQRDIVRFYLRNYTLKKNSKHSLAPNVSASAGPHFPKRILNPIRCRVCHQRVRWICELCDIALCVERDCFKIAHT